MPVLAVCGANSLGDFLHQQLQEVVDNIDGKVIENCGHWLSTEQPQQLTKILLAFLNK